MLRKPLGQNEGFSNFSMYGDYVQYMHCKQVAEIIEGGYESRLLWADNSLKIMMEGVFEMKIYRTKT